MPESLDPRPHTHRVTLLIALVGVLLAGYALWRIDNTRDREDATRDRLSQLEAADATLRTELSATIERDAKARADLQKQWQQLAELPQQLKDLNAAYEDLRARTERPQRAWNRAEALYLIELAQRRLSFDHDTTTAIAALESADSRLASLRDASLDTVRERIAKDLQTLRAVPEPDRTGIVTRLLAIESQAGSLPLKGILVGQRVAPESANESSSWTTRAWNAITETFERMFVVRRVDADHSSLVTLEQQALRRQHLALLVYSARSAAIRNDQVAYRVALDEASSWLNQYFDRSAAVDSASREIAALEQIDISPALPDISGAAKMLSRVAPTSGAP
jgi:uroporphyrin-III C-methyltransferase